jgi:hypothetical protein
MLFCVCKKERKKKKEKEEQVVIYQYSAALYITKKINKKGKALVVIYIFWFIKNLLYLLLIK